MSARLRRLIAMIALSVVPSCGPNPPALPSSASAGARADAHATSNVLVRHGSVAFPSRTTFVPGSLHVVNSLGSHELARDGTFDVVAYRGGPQFTLVTNDAGDAVLAGFVGPAQTRIDVTSTAKLLAFFASGSYALPVPDRSRALDTLSRRPGFARIVRVLDATLRADATALGRPIDANGSSDSFASAIDRFVATCRAPHGSLTFGRTAHRLARASATSRRLAIQRLMRTFLIPLVAAVLVPIDNPAVDARANDRASSTPVAELADLVLHDVPAISTFVDEGRAGDALLAAYTSIVGSDTARLAAFAMVRDGRGTASGPADGALYETASSIFATWDVLGSAFSSVPAAVVSDRLTPSR